MKLTRRSRFALPFVLVVGCGSSAKPANSPAGTANLPPSPGSGKVTKSEQNGTTVLTYESGDRVYVHADGTCHAEYSSNCGVSEGADPVPQTCNPPPPQQVQCPPDSK